MNNKKIETQLMACRSLLTLSPLPTIQEILKNSFCLQTSIQYLPTLNLVQGNSRTIKKPNHINMIPTEYRRKSIPYVFIVPEIKLSISFII